MQGEWRHTLGLQKQAIFSKINEIKIFLCTIYIFTEMVFELRSYENMKCCQLRVV